MTRFFLYVLLFAICTGVEQLCDDPQHLNISLTLDRLMTQVLDLESTLNSLGLESTAERQYLDIDLTETQPDLKTTQRRQHRSQLQVPSTSDSPCQFFWEYSCGTSLPPSCIPYYQMCDGNADCSDSADEHNCEEDFLDSGQIWQCTSETGSKSIPSGTSFILLVSHYDRENINHNVPKVNGAVMIEGKRSLYLWEGFYNRAVKAVYFVTKNTVDASLGGLHGANDIHDVLAGIPDSTDALFQNRLHPAVGALCRSWENSTWSG